MLTYLNRIHTGLIECGEQKIIHHLISMKRFYWTGILKYANTYTDSDMAEDYVPHDVEGIMGNFL